MLTKKIFLIFSVLILIASSIFAVNPEETEWGIQYKMNPRNPAPGDYVFLNIYSYSTNLDSSNISYIINGELKQGGTGQKNFNFKVPKNNRALKLQIIAKDFNGKINKKEIIIKPVSVDLIYEVVNPYRPAFYKGKSIATSHAEVKVFAFPNFINAQGKKLDPKSLIYTWKVNKDLQPAKSGLGKSTFHLNKIYGTPRETKVGVTIRSLDGTMVGYKSIIFKPNFTDIDFYVDEKVMPFRFKSVAKPKIISNFLDSDIVAIPYFFNDLNISNIKWVINNNKINLLSGGDNLRINIVRNKDNAEVELKIRLSIENDNRVLQAANSRVIFKTSKSLVEKYRNFKEEEVRKEKIKNSEGGFFGL